MKKFSLFLFALGTFAFTACSSLDVNKAESLEENYPKDFVAADYMTLHPGLRSLQIQDYVKDYNEKLTLDATALSADSVAFLADTAMLHQIFVNPFYAGYSEELWIEDWSPTISKEAQCIVRTVIMMLNLEVVETGDTLHVYPDSILYDADSNITAVSGFSDEAKTNPVSYTIVPDSLNVIKKGTQTGKDTVSCDTVEVSSEGKLVGAHLTRLKKFNFHNTEDDLTALAAVPVDTFAISSQYLMFGQSHGWAYRACLDSEKNNPVQSEVYPMKKLYCADGDVIREIAE